jgi:Xaa-Pro aminopeptidase
MKTIEQAKGNVRGLQSLLAESQFDAVIAVSPENVRYIGDVYISTQSSIRDRLAFIVWPTGASPVFIVCAVEESYVREGSWIEDIRTYREFHVSPIELLAEVLCELGLERSQVGLELQYLSAQSFDELTSRLPNLKRGSCDELFARARLVKTADEIETLSRGFRATEQAMLDTFRAIRAGHTEREMSATLADAILRGGADEVAFNHINAGANTGFPHKTASTYRVGNGDVVKADSGGLYQEYHSNVGRTGKLGKPTRMEADCWARLLNIHRQLVQLVRPGNCGRLIFEEAVKLHKRAGIDFPFGHNGHGIGLQVHEPPFISRHDERQFQPGMVTAIETRTRWEGKLGLHMNDLVEVTAAEPIVHTGVFPVDEILSLQA